MQENQKQDARAAIGLVTLVSPKIYFSLRGVPRFLAAGLTRFIYNTIQKPEIFHFKIIIAHFCMSAQ